MEPTRTIFHRGQDYPSSLSDTSEESSSSHSCLDDDELDSTNPNATTAAAATEDRETGVDIDDMDDVEFFDCIEGCDIDNIEAMEGIDGSMSNEAETGSLRFLTEGKPPGAIAIVISYVFVGKPKMVDISHSPRSSNDSRRWGLPPASRALIVQKKASLEIVESSSKSEAQSLAPECLNATPLPTESEPHFLTQPYSTTTTCYSDHSSNKSSWRGLVRSVSGRRRRTPKEAPGEVPKEVPKEEPEKAMLVEGKPDKAKRRPRKLGLKLPKTMNPLGGPLTPVTVRW